MAESRIRGRFRGCLLGVALGDAVGAPFEGMLSPDSSAFDALLRSRGLLKYTDDTHMTIGLAESLVANKGQFDGAHMADLLARNYRAEPWRGYGAGPPLVFEKLDEGVPWDKAGEHLFRGLGSFGNGSAMRVAPVALITVGNLSKTVEIARETSKITHTHELALQGAAVQACAIGLLLQHSPDRALEAASFLDLLARSAQAPEYLPTFEQIRILLSSDNPHPDEVAGRLGNGIEAVRSVPTALYCFLRHSTSFEEVLREAVNLGGDTDTIASMAGALSGAYLGDAAIPAGWTKRLEEADRLVDLAHSLFLLASNARQAG